jgi:two-component system CheB/CheR fusion protein
LILGPIATAQRKHSDGWNRNVNSAFKNWLTGERWVTDQLSYVAGRRDIRLKAPLPAIFVVTARTSIWHAISDIVDDGEFAISRFFTPSEFMQTSHAGGRGCVLIDLVGAADDGLSLLHSIRRLGDRMHMVLLSDRADIRMAVTAIKAGAHDVMASPFDGRRLLSCLRDMVEPEQRSWNTIRYASPMITPGVAAAAMASLTARQREILARIMQGQPNKIIAADLGISQRTAENHRATIMKKMGATSISKLVMASMGPETRKSAA